MKIVVAESDSIVVLERSRKQPFDFHFHVLDQNTAQKMIQKNNSSNEIKIFVDCDEDAFIIEKDVLEIKDSLSEIWKNRKVIVDQTELDQLFSAAPELFPILAIDLKGSPLMLAWGKSESVRQAVESGKGTYFSRSRNRKWIKGEESGHIQNLRTISVCANPFYIIYETDQVGAACHTGFYSCFFRQIMEGNEAVNVYPQKNEELK